MVETRERLSREERARRRELLVEAGPSLFGPSWQPALAEALSTERRPINRQRIVQWALGLDAKNGKPIPAWAYVALEEIVREGVARLREDADKLQGMLDGTSPAAPADETPPAKDSAPASKAPEVDGDDDGVDLDALVEQALAHGPSPLPGSDFPVYVPPPPPPRPEGWRSAFAERYGHCAP